MLVITPLSWHVVELLKENIDSEDETIPQLEDKLDQMEKIQKDVLYFHSRWLEDVFQIQHDTISLPSSCQLIDERLRNGNEFFKQWMLEISIWKWNVKCGKNISTNKSLTISPS